MEKNYVEHELNFVHDLEAMQIAWIDGGEPDTGAITGLC